MREAPLRDLFLRVAALPAGEQARALEENEFFQQLPSAEQERLRQRLAEFNAQPPERRVEFLKQARRGRPQRVGQGIFLRVAPLPVEEQQRALEGDEDFADLPPRAQERLRRHLEQFNSFTPEERRRRLDHMMRFSRLPPERRERLERRARRFAEMSPEAREEARRAFAAWQQLPPQRKQLFIERVRGLESATPAERSALVNDEQFLSPLDPRERQLFLQLWHLREGLPPGRRRVPRP